MTTRGSITTSSMNDSAALGTTEYSSTTSAPANSGRDDGPAVSSNASPTIGRTAMSESQQHATPAALLTSSPTGSSAGSAEQTSPTHETQEEKLSMVISTTSEGTTLPNSVMTSTLKAQGGTSRSTASSSMATTANPSEQNQSPPAAAPFTSSSAANGLGSSVSADSSKLATITTPTALNTSGIDITSSGSITTTVSEMSATTSRATLDKTTDAIESLPVTTRAFTHTISLTMTTLETTVPGTNIPGAQEGVTTAAPSTLTTSSTISTKSERHHNTVTQTPSSPTESAPSAGTATTPSPETTAAGSTTLTPISPGTTKSSTRTGVSQVSPKHPRSPGAEICALDEHLADSGGCMCNNSYYAHSELSGALVALRCQPQEIEVVLSSCFLKTRHWILGEGTFSGCSSVSKSEEGRRAQAFTVEKKEGSCGLHLSVNKSHALYSLEVQLLKSHPDAANKTDVMMLSLSCTYALVVNVTHPYPVVSFTYITIHILGTGDTIVILGIYTDPQCSSPLENRPAPLHKPLYVVLRATSSDPNRFALVVNEVFASTNISRTGAVKATHYFVKDSCPVSKRLLEGPRANGASLEVKLAFNPFHLLPSDALYLHSRVTLCDKQAGRPCPPTCRKNSPRGRSRAWEISAREGRESGTGWLVFGPIRLSESSASSPRSLAGSWMAIFLLTVIGWMLG
ncbi:hypothetical protein R6Z07M_003442 [Ovis aries]